LSSTDIEVWQSADSSVVLQAFPSSGFVFTGWGPQSGNATTFIYTHKMTGEVLAVRVRFRVRFRGELIYLMDEHHDAAYVEAFQRFVFHMQNARSGC